MWRPDSWENSSGKGFKYGGWTPPDEPTRRASVGIYEAGADAMLEALLKDGLRVNNLGDIPQGPGTIIFIPDSPDN